MNSGPAGLETLLSQAHSGDEAALGRLLSLVEKGGTPAQEIAQLCHPKTGGASILGVTGAPGAGKSTLTSSLASVLRERGLRLAILAIDPSSPTSGGAILGDRVRMATHAQDDGVFIRSMATRGNLGGLSAATLGAVRVLDAAGFDWIIIETVGVGQVELDISQAADTTLVVLNPGWGDEVQAAKAGLLEIADVFAINKADREGADQTERELGQMLSLRASQTEWKPSITRTVAISDESVDTLLDAVLEHRQWMEQNDELERRRQSRAWSEVEHLVIAQRVREASAMLTPGNHPELSRALSDKSTDPVSAAAALQKHPFPHPKPG